MAEQDLNYYIAQLELLRELERKNLIRSEVVLRHQDRIVTEMLLMVPSEAVSENQERIPGFSSNPVVLPSLRDDIFISYSHKDKKWLEKLSVVFDPLVRQGRMHLWSDAQIQPGDEWRQKIQTALARAKIAVLLVSPDFLASDFIAKYELPPLLKAAEQGGLTILWIAVRTCLHTKTDIAKYQAVNDPSKPLARLKPEQVDDELVRICEHIERAMER